MSFLPGPFLPSWPLHLGRTGLSKVSLASSFPLACFELWSPCLSSLMRNCWLPGFKEEMRFFTGISISDLKCVLASFRMELSREIRIKAKNVLISRGSTVYETLLRFWMIQTISGAIALLSTVGVLRHGRCLCGEQWRDSSPSCLLCQGVSLLSEHPEYSQLLAGQGGGRTWEESGFDICPWMVSTSSDCWCVPKKAEDGLGRWCDQPFQLCDIYRCALRFTM